MPGTEQDPLRVAVVGSGPAGFYTVQHLLSAGEPAVRVDMFDRLATPFGLVRHGVAPDHAKIKSVIRVYHKLASRPEYRFFGNVEFGGVVNLDTLRARYHQVVFATGAQSDRRLGIPGEDLQGSHAATEFVAWYNGHPDFAHLKFDLSCACAVVVGVGNVAVDVARILCRSHEELRQTDIADYALEALRQSRVRKVYLLGRRGPAQAAFTNPEVKELGELSMAQARTVASEVALDPLSLRRLRTEPDRTIERKTEILRSFAEPVESDRPKRLIIRFLISPTELIGDEAGRLCRMRLRRNELFEDEAGNLKSRSTNQTEEIETGLLFRSVGYRGVPLPGIPFDTRGDGIVPNDRGRVLSPDGQRAIPGLYVSGWIKRGPSGVIGTNKPDAGETVASMLEDLAAGRTLTPQAAEPQSIVDFLVSAGVRYVTYDDWQRIDAEELSRGATLGRPRVKITDNREFLSFLPR